MLKPFLDDLEARINAADEEELYRRWKDFYAGQLRDGIFSVARKNKYPTRVKWPYLLINEAIRADGYEKMLLRELVAVSEALEAGAGSVLCVRSNYGTGILPAAFGADLFFLDDAADTLPTSIPLRGLDRIRKIIDGGVPRQRLSLMRKIFEFAEYFLETTKSYPAIRKYVHLYHPDFQGPMDVVELLWGSALFLDIYDEPALVKQLLAIVTDAYIYFMRQWNEIMPRFDRNYSVHWGMVVKGQIMLRDDSAMNFSPEMYTEFIRPYDQQVFDAFDGGVVHFCGRGAHYIADLARMKKLSAVNVSQPELNDMDVIYENTVEKDIRIIGLDYAAAQKAQAQGRKFHGKVHC